ncbi:hypothetical protein A6R72_01895 [Xanthomonas translucens pv. graminis]|nr:hypothetical protein A6R72_01895 [Xanthomonas translucens pv. graminis]
MSGFHGVGVPTIREAQDLGIHRHQIEQHARLTMHPTTDHATFHLAGKAMRLYTLFDTTEPGPVQIHHRIDVVGRANALGQWIGQQQANDCATEEDDLLTQFA